MLNKRFFGEQIMIYGSLLANLQYLLQLLLSLN